ncbi:MAG TPA: NYN domain-containing protein [Ferruginibacter sp.]|nr:NYN domain-containing protein [Ferruginibacter sp.]
MRRVIVYFDGFNFYNGLKEHAGKFPEWLNYYWIDLYKLCQQFFTEGEGNTLVEVKYFTAPPANLQKRSRQSAFFTANQIINGSKVSIHNGHYTKKEVECFATCKLKFTVPEEKCTDVNLALSIVSDCLDGIVDTVVLVTADSDQVPTIKMVTSRFPNIKLKVFFPPSRSSADILARVKQVVFLENHEEKFKSAKMPGEVTDGMKKYTRPPEWKYKP